MIQRANPAKFLVQRGGNLGVGFFRGGMKPCRKIRGGDGQYFVGEGGLSLSRRPINWGIGYMFGDSLNKNKKKYLAVYNLKLLLARPPIDTSRNSFAHMSGEWCKMFERFSNQSSRHCTQHWAPSVFCIKMQKTMLYFKLKK